jgi:hypothetical protein
VEHQTIAEKASTNTFSTAALAAAAAGATVEPSAGLTRPAKVVRPKTQAAPAAAIAQTKVMGSTGVTAAPAQVKKKKKMLWIVIGAVAVVLAVIIWAMLPAKKADEPQEKPITFDGDSPSSDQPSRSTPRASRRSAPSATRSSEPAPRTASSGANDRLRSQQLTTSGYRRMKDRDFSGATQDFQDALALDPNNTAAQKGLQTAQAGQTVKGITDIFHR